MPTASRPLRIPVGDHTVSALLQAPAAPKAVLVLAHGAGAGMTHPFMQAVADGLAARGIATLRYQFPYMERGSKRTDPPAIAHATVRAAVAEATHLLPDLPLFAGGKSFGGRMTSQAQAETPLPTVRGLVFLGFPLHPADKPSTNRAVHLAQITAPMLFLQGSRDELASLELLKPVVESLGDRATLAVFEHADHSFHVLARSGRKDGEVMDELLDAIARWMTARRGTTE
jgi:predicted alpha/beta-hydrolase family hydrolase